MMLPILISVSVAPVSYFFCASAPPEDAASNTAAAEKAVSRNWNADIVGLPESCECVTFVGRERFAAPGPHSIPFAARQQEKAPFDLCRRGLLALRSGG